MKRMRRKKFESAVWTGVTIYKTRMAEAGYELPEASGKLFKDAVDAGPGMLKNGVEAGDASKFAVGFWVAAVGTHNDDMFLFEQGCGIIGELNPQLGAALEKQFKAQTE
jgi:hypothetical protein